LHGGIDGDRPHASYFASLVEAIASDGFAAEFRDNAMEFFV